MDPISRIVSPEEVYQHLNLSYSDEGLSPELVILYLKAAETYVEKHICRSFDTLDEREKELVKEVILLVVGDFFMTREDTVTGVSTTTTNAVNRLSFYLRAF